MIKAEQNLEMFGFDELSLQDIEQVGESDISHPAVMMRMYDSLKSVLKEHGEDTSIAISQLKAICETFGGIQIYLSSTKRQLRAIKIQRDFDGKNINELAKEHGISTNWVYAILKKMRKQSCSLVISTSMNDAQLFDNNQTIFQEDTKEIYRLIRSQLGDGKNVVDIAYEQLLHITEIFGSKQIYVPSGKQLESQLKKFRIWHDYNGNNVFELSEKYDVSMKHVWRILKDMRSMTIKKNQIPLF